ncbi:hypothetical protein ACFXTN_036758 [Malus domestica]
MGPMSSTILDMAQVFGLRPSSKIIYVTHDWVHSSRLTAESSGSSAPFLKIEYNSSTFKSYGTLFTSFIPFAKNEFGSSSSNANRDQEHMYFLLYWLNKHGEPFETNLNGPTWMIQLWLQWYFPELRAPNLEFPERMAPARILAEASPTNHSTLCCLFFFKVCRTRADLE